MLRSAHFHAVSWFTKCTAVLFHTNPLALSRRSFPRSHLGIFYCYLLEESITTCFKLFQRKTGGLLSGPTGNTLIAVFSAYATEDIFVPRVHELKSKVQSKDMTYTSTTAQAAWVKA